jgi:hypothetical protein
MLIAGARGHIKHNSHLVDEISESVIIKGELKRISRVTEPD